MVIRTSTGQYGFCGSHSVLYECCVFQIKKRVFMFLTDISNSRRPATLPHNIEIASWPLTTYMYYCDRQASLHPVYRRVTWACRRTDRHPN